MWLGCERLDRVQHEAAPNAASASTHLPVTAKSQRRHVVEPPASRAEKKHS